MMKMNKPCHAIATAKHMPIYLRLRKSHIVNGPGNSALRADVAVTRKIKGTAQRTENEIICETAAASDMSSPIISITIMTDIGTDTSQNSFHWFIALCCKTTFRSIVMGQEDTATEHGSIYGCQIP